MITSHYETIGAPPDASPAALRKAYLARARTLHPDQFAGSSASDRRAAERLMQELNAAWTVLSDPEARRSYDATLGVRSSRGTDPLVAARADEWRPFDPERSPTPAPPRQPAVADEREMEIRGAARILRPIPLMVLVGSVALIITVGALIAGDGGGTTDAPTSVTEPTGTPIGCINLAPVAEPVPCGNHDAVVWSIAAADAACTVGLEPIYRQGEGGLYCVTRVP